MLKNPLEMGCVSGLLASYFLQRRILWPRSTAMACRTCLLTPATSSTSRSSATLLAGPPRRNAVQVDQLDPGRFSRGSPVFIISSVEAMAPFPAVRDPWPRP